MCDRDYNFEIIISEENAKILLQCDQGLKRDIWGKGGDNCRLAADDSSQNELQRLGYDFFPHFRGLENMSNCQWSILSNSFVLISLGVISFTLGFTH